MSFARTFLSNTSLEEDLDNFFNYLINNTELSRKQLLQLIKNFKNSNRTKYNRNFIQGTPETVDFEGVSIQTSGIQLDHSNVKPRGGSQQNEFYEGPVRGVDGKVTHSNIDRTTSKYGVTRKIAISKKGERYVVSVPKGFIKELNNSQLVALLTRKSLSEEEYNFLKTFLQREKIAFEDVEVEKVTNTPINISNIVNQVERNLRDDPARASTLPPSVSPSPSPSKSQKLKLIKLTKNTAWDKKSHFVFRLDTNVAGKTTPIAFAHRETKTSDSGPLTENHIKQIKAKGWTYDLSFST